MLEGRKVVLGVTGSVAAYKAADLASKLVQAGAQVDVILTRSAAEFISALTFKSLTHRPVVTDLFDPASEMGIEHVGLAQRAEVVVIAPATANIIAKIANGLADDALSCTVLATKAPLIVAPAMDGNMYESPATQENVAKLKARGVLFAGPAQGRLASGLMGTGRLVDTETLLGTIRQVLGRQGDLKGKTIIVTAGGTQEPIDPVRVITNRSSGKMGYAIAEAARDRGAKVVLITAPTSLADPVGVEVIKINRAMEMRDAVAKQTRKADALIMAAAVADYQPLKTASQKIKKSEAALTIPLERTPDILTEVKGSFIKVGFAAESENLLRNAKEKLVKKSLDMIVANDITATDAGFSADDNRVIIIDKAGKADRLPLMPKAGVAGEILDRVAALLNSRKSR